MNSQYIALSGACATAMIAHAVPATAQSQAGAINLAPQPMANALQSIARHTGMNIVFLPDAVRNRQSRPVRNARNADDAVRQVIEGEPLVLRRQGSGTIVISAAPAAAAPLAVARPVAVAPREASPGTAARAPQAAPVAQEPPEPATAQEITVTGSRITRDGYDAPTPVTVATVDDLLKAAPTTIADGLNRLPQFAGSTAPNRGSHLRPSEPSGGYFLNLRGLGAIRTLVLLDGVRVPPTEFLGLVDVNIIPNALVERVDVVTAGASAAYGSDAISGVVNFVLDKNFRGLKGTAQSGISTRGDNFNYRVGLAYGADLGDRTHIFLSAERFESEGYLKSDRPYLLDQGLAVGRVAGSPSAPGTVANPLVPVTGLVQGSATFGGLVQSGPFADLIFTDPGAYRPIQRGTPTGTSDRFIGGDGYFVPGFTSAAVPSRNDVLFARIGQRIGDNVNAYVQGSFSETRVSYDVFPGIFFGQRINSGNPFLPAPLQAQLDASGTASFTMSKLLEELGPAVSNERLTNYNIMAGLEGRIGGLRWDVNYVHGDSVHAAAQSNVLELPKLAAALDAVRDANDNIVCRTTIDPRADVRTRYADCVPFNPFGVGASSLAARDYVTGVSRYRARNWGDSISANLSGDVAELWAGPLSIATGAEYRRKELRMTSNADPAQRIDLTGLELTGTPATTTRFFLNNVGTARGKLEVTEVFGEFALPLLADAPLARSLELNGAVRYAHYSTSGGATTWKLGASWRPVDDLRLRVTRSRDFRAPTLFDLFAGQGANNAQIFDPHTNSGGSGTIFVTTGGNPDLQPEIGNTLSAGLVFTPSFIPGLALSLDAYDIKVTDAIGTLTPQQIVQDCEDSGGTAPTCALVTRPLPYSDRTPANYPTAIRVVGANIAAINVRGLDIDATYRTSMGGGDLTLRLFANYTDRFRTQRSSTQPVLEYAGFAGAPVNPIGSGTTGVAVPRWRATASVNYTIDGFTVYVQEQMIGKIGFSPLPSQVYEGPLPGNIFYTDITLAQKVAAFSGDAEMFLTVTNLFDRKAPHFYSTATPNRDLSTETSLYDTNGRSFTAGVRFKF